MGLVNDNVERERKRGRRPSGDGRRHVKIIFFRAQLIWVPWLTNSNSLLLQHKLVFTPASVTQLKGIISRKSHTIIHYKRK